MCHQATRIVSALAGLVATASAFSAGLNFEGVALTPGATVSVSVPLSAQEKSGKRGQS